MTIALTTIGSRGVTLTVGPSALEEALDGVALKLTLHDGPLVLTLTRGEAQALEAELTEQLAESREAP
jgi:NAD-dependent DNA ligase